MAASAFSLRCSVKAQVNLAFDLRSSYTEPSISCSRGGKRKLMSCKIMIVEINVNKLKATKIAI
jgi:hypothetical protein